MHLRHACKSDVGIKRGHNEDSFLVNPALGLYVVADGMGGHAGGETASRVAVTTIEQEVTAQHARRPAAFAPGGVFQDSPLAEVAREALEAACAAVFHAARANPGLEGMGTTATALLVQHGRAVAAHVGDSRFYLVRGDHIQQITEDHSLVNEQVRAGILTPEQARNSRYKNIITRSIGFEEDVLVDVVGVELAPGDQLLLCSDGLSNLVEDYEMREICRTVPLEEVPQRLIDLANARGGDDNITVVVLEAQA
jgi:protein phosphatase